RLAKLEAVLALAGPATLADAPLYAALLAIPTGAAPVELSPQRQKDLTIDSLVRQLIGLSRTQPGLVMGEELHRIDPPTLELINRGIRAIRSAPVLFLLTFRPHFLPPWLEQSHVTMLRLERLNRDHAGDMIVDVAGGKPIPAEVSEQIISK